VPARLLTLELTETAILGSLDTAGETLAKLRELGVRTSCDDFGTGNNSLTRLQQMPLSELKIDRSFIAGIVTTRANRPSSKPSSTLVRRSGLTSSPKASDDGKNKPARSPSAWKPARATTCANPSHLT